MSESPVESNENEPEATSVHLRPDQKERLDEALPDGMARGQYIMQLIDDDTEPVVVDLDELECRLRKVVREECEVDE